MPIVVECGCGKRFKAQDAHAGKRTKCPTCGADLLIPKVAQATAAAVSIPPRKPVAAAPPRPAAKAPANPLDDESLFDIAEPAAAPPPPKRAPVKAPPAERAPTQAAPPARAPVAAGGKPPAKNVFGRRNFQSKEKEGKGPAINIGGGLVTWTIVAFFVVGGIIFAVRQGPVKANKQWETLGPQGESDVLTIVTRGVRGWYAAKGAFDDDFRKAPYCDHMFFDEPVLMWTIPDVINFQGQSSEGKIYGRYWPAKRELECDAKFNSQGITVKITGRFKDEKFEVEIDGKPAPELKPSGRPPRDDF